MQLLKKIPFTHDGNAYEIRILRSAGGITVAAFRKNHPVNGFRYHIMVPKHATVDSLLDTAVVRDMTDQSRDYVTRGLWNGLFGKGQNTAGGHS